MFRDNASKIAAIIGVIILIAYLLFMLGMYALASQQYKQVQHQASKASWTQAGNQVEYTVLEIKGHEYIACGRMISGSTVTLTHAASCPCMKHTVK